MVKNIPIESLFTKPRFYEFLNDRDIGINSKFEWMPCAGGYLLLAIEQKTQNRFPIGHLKTSVVPVQHVFPDKISNLLAYPLMEVVSWLPDWISGPYPTVYIRDVYFSTDGTILVSYISHKGEVYFQREFLEDAVIKLIEQNQLFPRQTKKPPLGVMPNTLFYEQRLVDLEAAMKRYNDSNTKVPEEWTKEWNWLRGALEQMKRKK